MKTIRLIGLLLVSALFSTSPALADKTPDVDAALTQWKAAVESGKAEDVMKLYDRHAIMISTFAQEPMTKRDEITTYYKTILTNPDIKVTVEDTHPRVFGTMAINTGRYTLNYTQEGEPISIPARFSFVYELEGGKWLIVDHHSSRVPLPDDKK